MFDNLNSRFEDFQNKETIKVQKSHRDNFSASAHIDALAINNKNLFDYTYNLFLRRDAEPLPFTQHIIIVGRMGSFPNIIDLLRKYSDRPIVLFSDELLDPFLWS